ncbi:hypothetical protein LCGC14_2100190 [marine sediment metagenome]|uniref:Uncharacterized protein n=1 Tax=marine sediment metagenome TaxID=412755 RepID=A0A0F9EXD9_9ZZZZ
MVKQVNFLVYTRMDERNNMNINVECTWGVGPDIILDLKDHVFILYEDVIKKGFTHGIVKNGSMDLNVEEAKILVSDLINAIKEVEELNTCYNEYIENESLRNFKIPKETEVYFSGIHGGKQTSIVIKGCSGCVECIV